MNRSSIFQCAAACLVAAAFLFAGCSSDTTSGETSGSLNLTLELANDAEIEAVQWTILRPGMAAMDGEINTSAPGATASIEVYGLEPSPPEYTINLRALTTDDEIECEGQAKFPITANQVSDVMVMINCKPLEPRFGSVRANGKFNVCAELTKMIVAPLQTSVGNDIDLSATAVDADDDDVEITWSATGGSIADPSAAETTYTCGEVGTQFIRVEVSDDGFASCTHDWTVPVACKCDADADCGEGGICVANQCLADPDLFCDTGICAEDSMARADCVGTFLACIAENPDEGECFALSLLECSIEVEYGADFEDPPIVQQDPDTLADDGWVVFANVFNPDGSYAYGYGTDPAPNAGAPDGGQGFCGVATGEGGPLQGDQQLVVFSDYNNVDQGDGLRVEANTFRERTITADDVGLTLSFSFDLKRGNINDPDDESCMITPDPPCDSEAFAFIKTVDPSDNFALTNLVAVDTTDAPALWGRLSLELTIDAGLVGQLLQVGFAATATNFEASAVFYDNVVVTKSTLGGGGGM